MDNQPPRGKLRELDIPENLIPKVDTSQNSDISSGDRDLYLPPSLRKKSKWPKILGIIVLVVIIAAVAAGGYWQFLRVKPSSVKPQTSSTPKKVASQPAVSSKHYDSTQFALGFDHPGDWTVDDSSNTLLTVMSPAVQLSDANGQNQTGQIVMTIQAKGTEPPAFTQGNAIAVLMSQKISYSKPSADQRAQTYLSYLQYAATTTHGALDAIYITGDNGYQKDQYIPKADVVTLDPLITVTFTQCANQTCSNGGSANGNQSGKDTSKSTPFSIAAASWSNSTQAKTVEAMLRSIKVQ